MGGNYIKKEDGPLSLILSNFRNGKQIVVEINNDELDLKNEDEFQLEVLNARCR